MASDSACDVGDMFQRSLDGTQQLLEASTVASSGLALSFARSVNLSLAVIAGLVCIGLGWRLYKDAVIGSTSGELSWGRLNAKLVASGPGVFLVLFGAWLVYAVVTQRVTMKSESAAPVAAAASVSWPSSRHGLDAGAGRFIQVASPPQPQPKGCLVRRYSKFELAGQGGAESFDSVPSIEASLDHAIATLQERVKADMGSGKEIDLVKFNRTLTVLNSMRSNLVRGD